MEYIKKIISILGIILVLLFIFVLAYKFVNTIRYIEDNGLKSVVEDLRNGTGSIDMY